MGLAGAQGEISFTQLFKKAEDALTFGLEWDYPLPKKLVCKRDVTQGLKPLSEEEILNLGETILKELTSRNPDFIFSNRIWGLQKRITLENSKGVSLTLTTQQTEVSLLFKHKESSNIIDGGLGTTPLRLLNTEEYLQRYTEILEGYKNMEKIPSGPKKVIFLTEELIFRKFHEILRGDKYYQKRAISF